MTLAFDMPDCPDSPIARMDPRWKLAGLLMVALAVALVQSWPPAVAALAGALLLVALAWLPWRWYLRRIALASVLFLLFMVWLPFLPEPEDATIELGMVTLSLPGLVRLGVLTCRLIALVSVMLVLVATAPLQDTFKAAHALRIPSLLVQLVLLTYRYVFLLIEEFDRLRTAVRVRGFRNRTDVHSYRTIGQIAGTLLVRSQERSERVAQAMRARGFDGRFRSLNEFTTTTCDVLAFAVFAGCAVGLVTWDVMIRLP